MTVRCQIALGASEKCVGQPGYSGFPWGGYGRWPCEGSGASCLQRSIPFGQTFTFDQVLLSLRWATLPRSFARPGESTCWYFNSGILPCTIFFRLTAITKGTFDEQRLGRKSQTLLARYVFACTAVGFGVESRVIVCNRLKRLRTACLWLLIITINNNLLYLIFLLLFSLCRQSGGVHSTSCCSCPHLRCSSSSSSSSKERDGSWMLYGVLLNG